jgi:hypothetical protein
VEKYGRARRATDENIIRNKRFLCRVTKATNTQKEYFILLAFPRQQRLRESASVLSLYAYCLFVFELGLHLMRNNSLNGVKI